MRVNDDVFLKIIGFLLLTIVLLSLHVDGVQDIIKLLGCDYGSN